MFKTVSTPVLCSCNAVPLECTVAHSLGYGLLGEEAHESD